MDKGSLLESLNGALSQEYADYIAYKTQASTITSLNAQPLREMLEELADDEVEHAARLRERIVALGGVPTMVMAQPKTATGVEKILALVISSEEEAVAMYTPIWQSIPDEEVLLKETIEHLLMDEQEHIEELKRLKD